jgi:crossover junction endodeoxyribonuclease RusA
MTHIILPYPPSTNRLWRTGHGRTYQSAEAKAFKALAAIQAKRAGMELREGPVQLLVILHPKKPKRQSGRPVRCIDLSNSIKVVEDALQGIGYVNDSQVVSIRAKKGEPVPCGALSIEVRAA